MLTKLHSSKVCGMEAVPVTVECDITPGIGIHLVGLADAAVKESLLRTVTALQSCGYRIPGKKVILNIAPADLHKSGCSYDLPVALSILIASGQEELENAGRYIISGELALDGVTRDINGAFQIVELAASMSPYIDGVILPVQSAITASDIAETKVFAAGSLKDAIEIIRLTGSSEQEKYLVQNTDAYRNRKTEESQYPDFKDIPGYFSVKRALEIAAAGGHHLLMVSVPGTETQMLAKAMTGILPPMDERESNEVTSVYSVAGRLKTGSVRNRPFRAPYHAASISALLGGGSGEDIFPGEVSLAHNGVLYIDEYETLPKAVKEAFRGPMEDREVNISRLKSKTTYPAGFQMVVNAKPCPCGWYGAGDRCSCTPGQRMSFINAVFSNPLTDHIDLQVYIAPPLPSSAETPEMTSAEMAERVANARKAQAERYNGTGIRFNADLKSSDIVSYCRLDEASGELMERLITNLCLSARSYSRILKIARTIADLDGEKEIRPHHIAEAASYRFLDRRITP